MNPWDFSKSISFGKTNLITDEATEKLYRSMAFIVNRTLSFHMDCIFFVNEINQRHFLPAKLQYDYLLHSIRKKSRKLPWIKGEKEEYIDYVKEYFKYNNKRASEALDILTIKQLNTIKNHLEKGGKRKNNE